MHLHPILALLLALLPAAQPSGFEIKHTLTHACARKTRKGDSIDVHYRGTLAADGTQFDASYDRGRPLSFAVGAGQVIKGWDEGLLDMCPGDKRTLTVPPEMGYGDRAMGPIPAGSTLVFETELVAIKGVEAEEKVVVHEEKPAEDKTEPEEPVPAENPQDAPTKEEL